MLKENYDQDFVHAFITFNNSPNIFAKTILSFNLK